jgi:LytS/YehU family sensor histidine kinase
VAAHVAFWLGVAAFFAAYFGREAESYRQSALFVALLMPVAMATTYALAAWLVPRYLLAGRTAQFAAYAAYVLVVSVWLELLVLVGSFVFGAGYDIAAMNPTTLDVLGLVVALYVVVLLGVAADLARRWRHLEAERQREQARRLEAELRLREAELARLRGQLQPHFLFNALNTIYGLTLESAPEAPEAVLRLSSLLDYQLYRSDQPRVPLSGEIEHLRAYLALERLRCGDRAEIRFDVAPGLAERAESLRIPPLLLIPLVENAFKHGVAETPGAAWVRIEARRGEDGDLVFDCENSVPERASGEANESGGLGLVTLRERLRMLGGASLHAERGATTFAARLRLPLASLR